MNAYIVAGYRSAVGKAYKGGFRFYRPDDLAVEVIRYLMQKVPSVKPEEVDDVIVGNAIPEAEQGLNMARMIALKALGIPVPGMTVNRYCASGLETIALASMKIHAGMADCIIAGGTESMSLIPMGGYRIVPNYEIALTHPEWYFSMGLTAEAVAREFGVTREECDAFAFRSHQRAIQAIDQNLFQDEIVPITVKEVTYEKGKKVERTYSVTQDEGPRRDTSLEALAKLKPVFAVNGLTTAGNASQTSDGAAFVMVVSESFMKDHELTPIARLAGYAVAGVDPKIMGIGPVEAVPKALKKVNMRLEDIDLIELNEAFATQALVVIKKLGMDMEKVNVNGGAIALGHPLGCTGAKLTIQIINELRRRGKRYGLVTACVGGGQGIAGIIERLD
jgi:acetyl-CoA acyltransferase